MSSSDKFFDLVRNPIKFRIFLLTKLPSAFFSGVRVRYADEQKAVVTIPYKWFSTNPFRSTYFACLSMAAEMSTGVLAMAHTYNEDPAVSMLVLKVEGSFSKKATGITTFTCEDGGMVKKVIREAASSGKGTVVTMRSVGVNKDGEVV
ncbi:MAG: thioesterase, partial [Sphingobacteriales bacterium]